ncbi:TPA: hypothetical protein ACIA9L_003790, partial [Salmonella enterica subsp. enterica serovar Java]
SAKHFAQDFTLLITIFIYMVVRNNVRRGQVRRIPNRRKAIERIVRINKVGDSKSSDRPGSTPPVLYRSPDGIKQAGKNQ